jgi:hypothetical protein
MGRITVTEQELLAEVIGADTRHPEDDQFKTTKEICAATDYSEERVRKILEWYDAQGMLEVEYVWRTCLDRRQQRKAAYRIKK